MTSVPATSVALERPPEEGGAGGGAGYFSEGDFEQLYQRYFHHVTRWVRAFGCPPADIDDVTQETFMIVRKRLDRFKGGNVAGWIYRIAQRRTRSHKRSAWVRRMLHGEPDDRVASSPHDSPVQALEQREARRQMQELLSRMSERRRTAFVLFEVEGYSGEEIAKLEGVALNTVYTRLHHARRDFMTLLARAEQEGQPR